MRAPCDLCGKPSIAKRMCSKHYYDARKDQKREYDRLRYLERRQETIDRAVAWRRENRRADFALGANQKAKRYGAEGRVEWRDLPDGDCAYCDSPSDSWDHVIPLSRGGPNTIENLVPCCRSCNVEKDNRTPEEWFAGLPAVRPKRAYKPWSEKRRKAA